WGCGEAITKTASRSTIGRVLVAAVDAAALVQSQGVASAATKFQRCGLHGRLACAIVTAPLDPGGHLPGHVSLAAIRYEQTGNARLGTVVAIAGGPGQSAIAAVPAFVDALRPILRDRALVVFDERG